MLVKKSYRTKSYSSYRGLPYSPQTISQHQQWCQSCLLSLHAVQKPYWSSILLLHYKYKKSALSIPGLLKLSIYIRNLQNYKFLHYLSANNHKCRLLIYEIPETLIAEEEEAEEGRFFACYLLSSRSPRYKGHTYIGFTVNTRRRVRQHNGEITQSAWRTKWKRPWETVLCIYVNGPGSTPTVSKAVRQAAASFKSLGGLVSKIKLAYTMLTLPPWQSLNITVNFFSTQYTKHSAGCPRLPEQMKVKVCSMDELRSCTKLSDDLLENEDEWCHERECDEDMNSSTLPEETLLDFRTHNSADDQQSDSGNRMNEVYGCSKEVGEDEWYNGKECDEAMNDGTLQEETLSDLIVQSSADDQQYDAGKIINEAYGCSQVVGDKLYRAIWFYGIASENAIFKCHYLI